MGAAKIQRRIDIFGVDTVLSNGRKATNGLAALADLDSNHDGVFNASGAQYANARLWRDLDQNGISGKDELTSLQASLPRGVSRRRRDGGSWAGGSACGASRRDVRAGFPLSRE
jgi:hypothetical protein